MALNWTIGNIRDWENVCQVTATEAVPEAGIAVGDTLISPVTNSLIWATIVVDLPGITEENAPEFWFRLSLYERMFGSFLRRGGEDRPFTADEVVAHIGLTANVSAKTRAAWMKRMMGSYAIDSLASFKAATERVAVA